MIKWTLAVFLLTTQALAYVPTVESLFRHGPNPDITANGVSLTLVVRRFEGSATKDPQKNESSLLTDSKTEDFYKLFFTRINSEIMKVAQTRYENSSFSEASLLEKEYFTNFSAYTLKGSDESSEKGIFHAMLRSIVFNDGAFVVNYLKTLNVPVKLNGEIINRQKVEYLANYKQYLLSINKDRTSRKTLTNPMKPEDAGARDRVEQVMSESMYVDQKQVKLSREDGQMSWLISAGAFEAVLSYKEREIQKIKYKTAAGEIEIQCKDYWLANGTHAIPKYLIVKDFKGESYQVELTNFRHYLEKESDLVNRLKKWDELLKNKTSQEPKPAFIL